MAKAKGCSTCAEIGESVSWESNLSPRVLEKLVTVSDQRRRCPGCGTEFVLTGETADAADHWMPDTSWTLTRV